MRTLALIAASILSTAAAAQIAPDPTSKFATEWNSRLSTDWPFLARYRSANAAIVPDAQPRIVFMGDSITEGWMNLAGGFFTPGRIDRGISGQTTPQMLVRFAPDVLALHPAVVHIMAGTNDIAGNTGPMTPDETKANIRAMVTLAHAAGIRVILGSIPPADLFPWKPGLDVGAKIVALNDWLRDYAARSGCIYADYWDALRAPGSLGMREGLSSDHVHPTAAGYAVMQPVAERAIRAALALPRPKRVAVD